MKIQYYCTLMYLYTYVCKSIHTQCFCIHKPFDFHWIFSHAIREIFVFVGSEAVLGPMHGNPAPIEQQVGRQKLRAGSGFLSVRVTTDGPTRVLQVLDIKERVCVDLTLLFYVFWLYYFLKLIFIFRRKHLPYSRNAIGRTSPWTIDQFRPSTPTFRKWILTS